MKLTCKELCLSQGHTARAYRGQTQPRFVWLQSPGSFPTTPYCRSWEELISFSFDKKMLKPAHDATRNFQGREFHDPTQCLTALVIRKSFTHVTNIPPNNVEIHFLLTGFCTGAVTWQLSWYQNSHQDPILTLQEVLDLLASACECSHWLLCTPTPNPRQCWGGQVSQGVRKWHSRTYWLIITHRGVKLTTQSTSGIVEKKMAPPFSSCRPFSWFLLCLHQRPLNHWAEECVCFSEKSHAPSSSVFKNPLDSSHSASF